MKKNKNIFENPLDIIADSCNNKVNMSEIRKAILNQMEKSGMTIYQVAKLVEGKVPQRTVYAFLRSEEDSLTKTASIYFIRQRESRPRHYKSQCRSRHHTH